MIPTIASMVGALLALELQAYGGDAYMLQHKAENLPYLRSRLEEDLGLPQSQSIEPPTPEDDPFS